MQVTHSSRVWDTGTNSSRVWDTGTNSSHVWGIGTNFSHVRNYQYVKFEHSFYPPKFIEIDHT